MLAAAPGARAEPPRLWDPGYRTVLPDLSGVGRLRFLTSLDFPPFNFADATRRPTGFNVDLARAICDHLDATERCEIQAMPWDELEGALEAERGDVILAGSTPGAELRARFGVSEPYFRFPARFVGRRGAAIADEGFAEIVNGSRVAVVAGSAHQAMLAAFFPGAEPVARPEIIEVYDALTGGDADFIFGDGVTLSFWLAAPVSEACCQFVSGPYLSHHFLGLGMVAVTRPEDRLLLDAINAALKAIEGNGVYDEIYTRYFPVDPYGR